MASEGKLLLTSSLPRVGHSNVPSPRKNGFSKSPSHIKKEISLFISFVSVSCLLFLVEHITPVLLSAAKLLTEERRAFYSSALIRRKVIIRGLQFSKEVIICCI